MTYDLNFLDNSTGLMQTVEGVNSLTDGMFFTVILGLVALVILIVYSKDYDLKKVLLADGFITTLIGVFLWTGGLASFLVVTLPIVLLFVGMILTVFQSK